MLISKINLSTINSELINIDAYLELINYALCTLNNNIIAYINIETSV